jgi:NAD(P)-dependent dehydrogenase (short-subunit alcohol dehydrogenase family)
LPRLGEGASIIMTGSVAGLLSSASSGSGPQGLGGAGYNLAKRVIVEYSTTLAVKLAPKSIRVNAVHPTNCNTDMLQSQPMYNGFRPDLENPTKEDCMDSFPAMTAMGNPWVEPVDISNGVLFLASDEARYVTGLQLRVDAGGFVKYQPYRIL